MAQQIIEIDASKPIRESVRALQIPSRPLIVLLGATDASLADQVRAICRRVIAPAAVDPGALILDNGSCSSCAAVIGRAAADQDQTPPLLAVIPHDRAASDIDPNHEQVLRLPSAWPDEVKSVFQIADGLIEQGDERQPALVMLFGGGAAETKAVIRAAERGWPVLVLKGTGGLADTIADAVTPQPDGSMPPPPADPDLREIAETAQIYIAPIGGGMDDLKRILLGRIETRFETAAITLARAWQCFDDIDAAASGKQRQFRRIELSLIVLAVLAALFAILTSPTAIPANLVSLLPKEWSGIKVWIKSAIHIVVILIPIGISIVAAYNSHFRDGNKWVLLRGAAEALKREIFRFRAKAGVYSDPQCLQSSRESKLAAKIRDITAALEQSDVNKTDLAQQPSGDPKRATFLTPSEYVEERIRDQAVYFASKTRGLSKQLAWTQSLIYVVGGTGTFLAAMRADVWVALTTAIVAGLATKLQANQVETSLVQYNQALVSLQNIDRWWNALSAWEKSRRNNIDVLVDQTEKALESEMAGWVQQMQSALDKLTEKEPPSKAGAVSA